MTENTIKTIFNLISNIADFLIVLIYFNNFLNTKTKNKAAIIISGFVFSVLFTVINICGVPALNTAGGFALLFICSRILFSDNWTIGFSIAAVFVALSVTSELFIASILLVINKISMLGFWNDIKLYILGGILSKVILYFIILLVVKIFPRKYYTKSPSNVLLLSSFPILSLVAMYALLNYSSYQPISFIENLFIYILLICILLSSVISFFIFDSLLLNARLKSQLELSEKARQINKAIFDEKERSFKICKEYIHDFKQNLYHIHALYEEGDNKNAVIYENELLKRLDSQINASSFDVGNPIISNSLERARQLCEMDNIAFSTDIMYDQLGFIEYLDASTLFDNIIDNAIYACNNVEENKWITISLKLKNNNVYLSVRNSKANKIIENNGRLLSTKRGYNETGVGIKNVRFVAEKYNGDIVTEYFDDEFRIAVRLEIPMMKDGMVLTEKRESFV